MQINSILHSKRFDYIIELDCFKQGLQKHLKITSTDEIKKIKQGVKKPTQPGVASDVNRIQKKAIGLFVKMENGKSSPGNDGISNKAHTITVQDYACNWFLLIRDL